MIKETTLSNNQRPFIAGLFSDLGLEPSFSANERRYNWAWAIVNTVKFEVELTRGSGWRMCLGYGHKDLDLIKEAFPCTTKNAFYYFDDLDELSQFAQEALTWIQETFETVAPKVKGIAFEGTNFAGYGERDFMAAVVAVQNGGYATLIPGVGSNLGFEFQVPSTGSRIDAVEFDAEGSVVTVIECQSGIQHGEYLDGDHFEKAISRYPQSEEVVASVKKIVIIAGGYHAHQLATFAQLPYEIVALVTSVVDGKVVLVPAA